MKIAVKKVPPNVAKDVRAINKGDKKLDHPYYQVEKRKGTGKATCRQCDTLIDEGEPTLYFHYAPEDDNTWIRTRGTIHADDCEGGKDEWTKCPKCRKQIPRADWSSHWAKEKGKRVAGYRRCVNCEGSGIDPDPEAAEDDECPVCEGSGISQEDDYVPNEKCSDCGLEIENNHYSCQGHQNCLPECPQCGGELIKIGKTKTAGTPMHDWHMMRPDEDEEEFILVPKEIPVEQPIQVPVKEPVKVPEKVPAHASRARTPIADWHMMDPDEDEEEYILNPKEFPVKEPVKVPVKEPVREPVKVPAHASRFKKKADDDEDKMPQGEITPEGKIIGYKYFKLKHKDGNWLFASPAQRDTPLWPKGEVTAVCGNGQDHVAPGPKQCNCGIHMCHSEDSPTLQGYKQSGWLARLEGYGSVKTGSMGPDVIRAQHVQVVGIRPPACEQCDKPASHLMSVKKGAFSGIPLCEEHLPDMLEGGDKPHAMSMQDIAKSVSNYYGGLTVKNVGEPWEDDPFEGEKFKSSSVITIKKAHCGQCDEDYDDSKAHKHKTYKEWEKQELALIEKNPANNVGPYKRGAQGLDPTAKPGNSTSMGDDPQKIKPRVDPYTTDKIEDANKKQLDQEARKLQRGMKSLDTFAGSWKSVSHGPDPKDLAKHIKDDQDEFKNLKEKVPENLKGTVQDMMDEDDELIEKLGWKRVSSVEIVAAHNRDWWKYKSPYMKCDDCGGDNPNCYRCEGSGIARTPKEGKSPIPACKCTYCTGNTYDTGTKSYDMWGNQSGGYIRGLRPWSGMFKGGVPPKVYPDHAAPCGRCKGTGNGWKGESKGCYSCGGSGTLTEAADPRNKLEDILDRHSKGPSKKYIVGIDNNTGLHEDEDHYNIKFHNTDILSFHKTKPEVTIDTGGFYNPVDNYNRMEGITTKHRMNDYLPQNISVEVGEVAPKENALLVTTHAGAYKLRDGQTYDMKTGLNVSSGIPPEYQKCKECHRYRDAEEMPKHQKRHDQYRARMDRQRAEYLNGPSEPRSEPPTNLPGQTKIPV